MVTIVICYKKGTGDILSVNLASLARHTKDVPYNVVVLAAEGDVDEDLESLKSYYRIKVQQVGLEVGLVTTKAHGIMLDQYIPEGIDTEYVMTLDSDCFPIADGWLSDLLKMNADVTGILHPWAPPPPDMNKKRIEWRVRSQHCWESTHVACQMLKTSKLKELGVKYNAGDDTGLAIVAAAKANGLKIDGYKATRCPIDMGGIDPEFNRYIGLVFGDKVYHHGGWTRTTVGNDKPVFGSEYEWVAERILKERGAEWLLDDMVSYSFTFDREEEVAKEKMDRLFGMERNEK
jgi:hypothetical protein